MKESNLTVSFFQNKSDKAPLEIPFEEVFKLIRSGRYREITEKYRYFKQAGLEQDAGNIKKKCTAFLASTLCEGGHGSACIRAYRPMATCDLDNIPEEEMERCCNLLFENPYVILSYITISGHGIRIVYRTDVTDIRLHPQAFTAGNQYFSQLLGVPYDKQCKNANRLNFLAFDPQAYWNPEASIFHIPVTPTEKKAAKGRPRKRYKATAEAAATVIAAILEKQGKVYANGSYNDYVSSALYLMNDFGVPKEEAREWACRYFSDYDSDALQCMVRSVYLHEEEHGKLDLKSYTGQDKWQAGAGDIKLFLTSQCQLRNNVLSGRLQICWKGEKEFIEVTDEHENTLWVRAEENGIICPLQKLLAILHSEFVPDYNPLKEYLQALPPWDGKDYIGLLAQRITTTPPELFHKYFKKWFVAVIASMWDEKTVNHTVLTFIGRQGIYKTSFFDHLLPPELHDYFYLKSYGGHITKDDLLRLGATCLICVEELDAMTPVEENRFKAMVTLPSISERPAYGRHVRNMPHVASFCATGNNKQFLTDDTDSRRWLPFWVTAILSPFDNPVDYTGIYSQGMALFLKGFKYWFEPEEYDELYLHNQDFEMANIEMELINCYFRVPAGTEKGTFMPTAKIIERIGLVYRHKLSPKKVAQAMIKLGFPTFRSRQMRGFMVVESKAGQSTDVPGQKPPTTEPPRDEQSKLPF